MSKGAHLRHDDDDRHYISLPDHEEDGEGHTAANNICYNTNTTDERGDAEAPTEVHARDRVRVVRSLSRWVEWRFTEADPIDSRRQTTILVFLASIVAGLIYGYNISLGGVLDNMDDEFHLDSFTKEALNSSTVFGGLIAASFAGWAADRFGRRPVITFASVLSVVSSFATIACPSPWYIVVVRFILGIGMTMTLFVGPVVVAESCRPKMRGLFVAFNQVSVNFGMLGSYLLGFANSWRLEVGVGACPAIICLLFFVLLMPESPRWILAKEQEMKRRQKQHRRAQREEIDGGGSELGFSEAFKLLIELAGWKKLCVGIALAFANNGINPLLFYGPQIFTDAGFEGDTALLATVGIASMSVVTSGVGMMVLSFVKRRKLVLWTTAVMALSMVGFAVSFVMSGPAKDIILITSGVVLVTAFQFGPGPLLFVVVSELYPQRVRATAMGVMAFVMNVVNLVMAGTWLSCIDAFGSFATFLAYGIILVACFCVCLAWQPETKGKDLEELEREM